MKGDIIYEIVLMFKVRRMLIELTMHEKLNLIKETEL